MTGQWRSSDLSALSDGLRAGQAEMVDCQIIPHDFVQIEREDGQLVETPAVGYFKRAT